MTDRLVRKVTYFSTRQCEQATYALEKGKLTLDFRHMSQLVTSPKGELDTICYPDYCDQG